MFEKLQMEVLKKAVIEKKKYSETVKIFRLTGTVIFQSVILGRKNVKQLDVIKRCGCRQGTVENLKL